MHVSPSHATRSETIGPIAARIAARIRRSAHHDAARVAVNVYDN